MEDTCKSIFPIGGSNPRTGLHNLHDNFIEDVSHSAQNLCLPQPWRFVPLCTCALTSWLHRGIPTFTRTLNHVSWRPPLCSPIVDHISVAIAVTWTIACTPLSTPDCWPSQNWDHQRMRQLWHRHQGAFIYHISLQGAYSNLSGWVYAKWM